MAAKVLEEVGLSDFTDSRPYELSGGMKQRAAIARALVNKPRMLLMDEPFAAIDPVVRVKLQEELLALQARLHKTIILVTHDINEAIRLGDRIACGLRISHRGIVRRAAGQHGDAEDGCKETGCGTPRETGHRVAFLNSATVSTWWVVG